MDKGNLEHKVQEWRKKRAEKLAMRLQIHSNKKRTVSGLVLGMTHDLTVQLPSPPLTKSVPDLRIQPGPLMRKSLSSGDVYQRRKSLHPGIINHDPRSHHHSNQYYQQELYNSPHYNNRQECWGKNSFSEPRKSFAAQGFKRNHNNTGSSNTNWQRTPSRSSCFGLDRSANKKVILSGKTPKTPNESAFRNKTHDAKNNPPKSVHFHADVKFAHTPENAPEILPTAETEETLNGTFLVDEDEGQTTLTTHESSSPVEKTSVGAPSLDPSSSADVIIDEPVDVTDISCNNAHLTQLDAKIVSDGHLVTDARPNLVMDVNQSGLLDSVQIVETIEVFTSEESDIKNLINDSCTQKDKSYNVIENSNRTLDLIEDKNSTFEVIETNENKNTAFELTETNENKNATFELTETNENKNATFELTETNENKNATFELTETNENKNATFEVMETNESKNAPFEVIETSENKTTTFETIDTVELIEEKHFNTVEDLKVTFSHDAEVHETVEIVVSSSSENMDENTQQINNENILPRIQGQATPLKKDGTAKDEGKATIKIVDGDLTEKLDNMYITPMKSARKSRILIDSTNIVQSSSISFVEVKNKEDPTEVLLTPVRRSTRKKAPVASSQEPSQETLRKAKVVPNPFLNA